MFITQKFSHLFYLHYMTPSLAFRTGSKKSLRTTIIITLVLVALFIIRETRGDFANGILFAIQDLTNPYFITFLCILFTLTWLSGGLAGRAILLHQKSFILIGFLYGCIIALLLFIYILMSIKDINPQGLKGNCLPILKAYFTQVISPLGIILFIIFAAIWLGICYQIKKMADKPAL